MILRVDSWSGSCSVSIFDLFINFCAKPYKLINTLKIIIEKHEDGFVSYPLGLKGVVVGQGDTYEEALANVKSAINFHIETFGPGDLVA